MALTLDQIKTKHDKAYVKNETTRRIAADDLVFYFITQWDDNLMLDAQLGYRGQFDILRKAGRQILSDLTQNPVQADFEPRDDDRLDSAEVLDGLYRNDDQNNASIEAYYNGKQEAVVCGSGAWKIYTKYKKTRSSDKTQVICREPIFEANNVVFWDPGSKMIDRSDAKYCSYIHTYTLEGYKELVNELTGEEIDEVVPENFKSPEFSYVFPWILGESERFYIGEFYQKEVVIDKILTMTNPFGQTIEIYESELTDFMEDMIDAGFEIDDEREVERGQITQYIVSGEKILSMEVIPGEHIPIIPIYGEHAVVEGGETWEGIVKLAKDPQRLRNFALSYLADIVSRSPRRKPIFTQEQIAGFENMYSENGPDNNFPYVLQNMRDAQGNLLPIGPVGELPEQPMPTSLPALLDLTKQAVEDVANPGVMRDIMDIDLSGKAIQALNSRLDQQSQIYQQNYKHAKRRDAEVYASIAAEIYDVPQTITMALPDGTRKKAEIMQSIIDEETGGYKVINDLRNVEFDVYTRIGPDYKTQRDETLDKLIELIKKVPPTDPMQRTLILKALHLTDGADFDDIRDFARKQLILAGVQKPDTPEEEQMVQAQMQQGQEPSPEDKIAQAEMLKGQADMAREQRENVKMQLDAQNNLAKTQIDTFNAQTNRMKVQVDAQKAGAELDMRNIDAIGKQLDNALKSINIKQAQTQPEVTA
jgi:hypothetical protein